MSYLLLTKHGTPSGVKSDWEMYNDLEAAKIALEMYKRQSKEYEEQGLFCVGSLRWGWHAPILVQSTLLKVEEVV